MYLYIIFTLLAILSFFQIANYKIKQYPHFYDFSYWIWIWILIFISGFRWENGTDWDTYYTYFNWLKDVTCIGYMEPGFTLLTSFNSHYFNYTTQLTSIAILSIVPIALQYKRISPYPLFSLFIWYATNFANIFSVRQTIAISLFVFSWKFIEEKKLWRFLITIAIAMSFHLTAFVVIPTYFIWHRYFSARFYIIVLSILTLISFSSEGLMQNIIYAIGGDLFKEKLEFYMEQNADSTFGSAYSTSQILIRGSVNRIFLFFIPLIFLNKLRLENSRLNAIYNFYFYSYVLFLIVSPISPALGRLGTYTDMAQALLIPYLFTIRIDKKNTYLLIVLIIFYFIIRFKGIVFNYYDVYIPYNFVLFQ